MDEDFTEMLSELEQALAAGRRVFCVLFDAYGDKDIVDELTAPPTLKDYYGDLQTVGYGFGGYIVADTPEEALVIADEQFDGYGCIA